MSERHDIVGPTEGDGGLGSPSLDELGAGAAADVEALELDVDELLARLQDAERQRVSREQTQILARSGE